MANNVTVDNNQKPAYKAETIEQGSGEHRQVVHVGNASSIGGTGGTAVVDDADFTAATTSLTPIGGVYESTPTTVTDGDMGMAGIDANRHLKVALSATDNAVLDSIATATAATQAAVEGTLTVTGGGGGTEYTEDAAAAANPVGTALILVREDARAGSLTSLDGDNVALRGNNKGEAYVIDTDANALLTTIDADTSTIAGDTTSIDGKITACNTGAVVISSGTVTANLGATDNAVLDAIAASDASIDGKITACNTGAVVIASGTTAVTNIGTFATQATLQAGTAEIGKLAAGIAEIGNVKNSGTFAVQSTLQTGAAAIGKLAANSGVDIGDVTINNSTGASAVNIQDGGNSITVDGTVAVSGTVTVGSHAVTNAGTFATQSTLQAITGQTGATTATLISAATTNATSTKASAGKLYGYALFNANAAARYVKFYNKASAPTVGTDVAVLVILVPAGGGANLDIPVGLNFSTGIAFATTTGAATADTGAVAVSEILVNFWYK
mgnify:CR=1 FL=1